MANSQLKISGRHSTLIMRRSGRSPFRAPPHSYFFWRKWNTEFAEEFVYYRFFSKLLAFMEGNKITRVSKTIGNVA
jgi:hypothetical protein